MDPRGVPFVGGIKTVIATMANARSAFALETQKRGMNRSQRDVGRRD